MANSIVKLVDSTNRLVIKLFGDSTETRALKIDTGALAYSLNVNNFILGAGTDRKTLYALSLRRAIYDIQQGDTSCFFRLSNDAATPNTILTFSEAGDMNLDIGGPASINCASGAANGNIFGEFICTGNAAYSIILDFRKEARHYDQGQTADPIAFNRGPAAMK